MRKSINRTTQSRCKMLVFSIAFLCALSGPLGAATADGTLLYSAGSTTPQSRLYNSSANNFAAAAATAAGAAQTWTVVRFAPTRNEAIAGYVTTGGVLYVLVWNGSAWTNAWNVTVGGTGVNGRRFDIAYERTSGRALVVYSRNVATTNELAYRIWNGTAWTAATTLDSVRLTGTANAVKLAPRVTTGSNEIAMAVADTGADLTAMIWSGTGWVSEPGTLLSAAVGFTTNSGENDNFDLAWESLTGTDLFVIWSENAQQSHRQYTRTSATAGTWGANTSWATARTVPLQMFAAADPLSDRILFGFNRSASAMVYGRIWNGTAMSAVATAGTNGIATAVNRRTITGGWLTSGATSAAVVMWMNNAATNNRIDYAYSTNDSTFTQNQTATFAGTSPAEKRWMDFATDPFSPDRGMLTFSDSGSDVWAKRLVFTGPATFTWTNADGGAALGLTLASINTQNFFFDYDRLPPSTTIADGTNPGGSALCPGGPSTAVDSFVLSTTKGTDTVTGATVALTSGSWEGLSAVEVTNDAETVIYGTAVPAADSVAVAFTTNIAVTTTATAYHVRVKPKDAAAMPPIPGGVYSVGATVSSLSCSNMLAGSDATSATATVDNASPSDPTWAASSPGNAAVTLNWTNPGADFFQVVVLRSTSASSPDRPVEGVSYTPPATIGTSAVAYAGSLATFTDNAVTNGTTYYYTIFARDACGNYSSGTVSGPLKPEAPNPRVSAGGGTATRDSCTQVTLSVPFSQDTPVANSTTTFERATAIGGPWTAVCTGVTGASPRTCVNSGLVSNTTYYFRVTFSDPDGVEGQNPQIVGPVTTSLSCSTNGTTVGTLLTQVNSCSQVTAIVQFTGDDDGDGYVKVEYNTTNTWPGTTACVKSAGSSPRECAVSGLAASTGYYVRVTYTDPDGVTGTNPQMAGPVTTTACGADSVAPMVLILAPSRDAVLNGSDRMKVQVWDAGGLAASAVQFAVDAGAFSSTGVSQNANYVCGSGCSVYEFDLATAALANGVHSLSVRATDVAGNTAREGVSFIVNNGATAAGGGMLLRRTQSSQFCNDCHAVSTHSSQSGSGAYGNWAVDCMTCHTPHNTTNVELIRSVINTPRNGKQAVDFRITDRANATNPQYSLLGDTSGVGGAPFTDGICETCHTKTTHHRNDTSGGDHTHYAGERCTGCHKHTNGFVARESNGGYSCADCHGAIWRGMTGATAKTSKHSIGSVVGVNDGYLDNAASFAAPLRTSTAPSNRLCLSCHQDHVHNPVGGTTHNYNVHQDASTGATRSVTRNAGGSITGGTPGTTDFDNAATNGGMCISCHRNALETGGIAITKTDYNASAHNYTSKTVAANTYTYTYQMHGANGTFNRNCTKCHSDSGEDVPGVTSIPLGTVHYSDNPDLLAGTRNPNGAPGSFLCYDCHGNGTTGTDRSGKNIATQMAKGRNHPTNSDSAHDGAAEYAAAAFGNTLGGRARHANCMDCHDSHKAKAGTRTKYTSNAAGPSLNGAWGAQLSTYPTFWSAPTSANFTKKVIVSGTDAEATLCFKCHSSYYGTLPTSPSGGFTETDTAREFNPNNAGTAAPNRGSFHPVLASAGNNLGATSNIIAPWTRTSLMTCSDCHASDTTTDPAGPHGSAAGFLLKGPNTTWNATIATLSSGMPNGTFCINCHNQNFTNSRFPAHATRNDHWVACWNCHAAIPHGTARPGLLVAVDQSPYGNKTTDTAPYRQMPNATSDGLYILSYPANNTTAWGQNNCGCGAGGGH